MIDRILSLLENNLLSVKRRLKFFKTNYQYNKRTGILKKRTLYLIIVLFGIFILFPVVCKNGSNQLTTTKKQGYSAAIENYSDEIKKLAREYDLSYPYLMALIMLESSGQKNVPPRFEKHIYNKLVQIREGKLDHLENITIGHLYNANNEALKNLASSWGPFQLMGYKCIQLGVEIKDIRGPGSLRWGVYWINKNYGYYIKNKRFKDAFHIHNTGQEYPKNGKPFTYDPTYVAKGMAHMEYFDKLEKNNK